MITTRHGSCHCEAIAFECAIDLAPAGQRSPQLRPGPWYAATLRCNCSYCRKTRIWKNHVPAESFRLERGEDALTVYKFADATIAHCFCGTCGVNTFARASEPVMGGDFVCVNVACLDDVSPEEFAAAPVRYEDGAHDDWGSAPEQTAYL